MCYKTINAADSVSTNMTNTVSAIAMSIASTNVTTTVSINFHNKKVRYKIDCYILNTFLLGTILIFIIAIILCHYIAFFNQHPASWRSYILNIHIANIYHPYCLNISYPKYVTSITYHILNICISNISHSKHSISQTFQVSNISQLVRNIISYKKTVIELQQLIWYLKA